MNFKLVTCYRSSKHPKISAAAKSSAKKRSKKRKKSRRVKNTYLPSNLVTKNFYPANYFFQDEPKLRDHRVGGNGFLITRNTPHNHQRRALPSSRILSAQFQHKVGECRSKWNKRLYRDDDLWSKSIIGE